MATLIDDIFELLKTAVIVFLILGVWACAHKIKDLEEEQRDRKIFTGVESDSSKIMACAMRINSLEHEVDMLRLRIEEIEDKEIDDNNEDQPAAITNAVYRVSGLVANVEPVDDLIQ